MIASLRTAAEFVGRKPSVDDYKAAATQLAERGIEIEPFHTVVGTSAAGGWPRRRSS